MKPQNINTLVQSNIQNSSEFSIKSSAFAFDILSDKLYSDKILAVVREYLTNALDAQRANNVVRPLEVNLPSNTIVIGSIPWEVRDFGTGLSEEDVYKYYCVYFSSSKQESNDFTGMLGLGCKAGFAYTQQFSITSWFNGEESKYLLFKENGYPKVSKLYSKPSKEHSGVKVTINVQPSDISQFTNKTEEVLKYFPEEYIPDWVERLEPKIETKQYIYLDGNSDCGVLMGNVMYPFPMYGVKNVILKKPIGFFKYFTFS